MIWHCLSLSRSKIKTQISFLNTTSRFHCIWYKINLVATPYLLLVILSKFQGKNLLWVQINESILISSAQFVRLVFFFFFLFGNPNIHLMFPACCVNVKMALFPVNFLSGKKMNKMRKTEQVQTKKRKSLRLSCPSSPSYFLSFLLTLHPSLDSSAFPTSLPPST